MASQATPSKRPFLKNSKDHGGRGKWKKAKHAQLKMRPSVPVFRILCPASKSGNVIEGGSIIAKIRQETGVKITVEESDRGCDERVIFISASEKDKETSHEQDGENDGGVAFPLVVTVRSIKTTIKRKMMIQIETTVRRKRMIQRKTAVRRRWMIQIKTAVRRTMMILRETILSKKRMIQQKIILRKYVIIQRKTTVRKKWMVRWWQKIQSQNLREIPSVLKALLLIFDRIFATEDVNETGDVSDVRHPVSMRLLVLYTQAGWLLGKNGSVIKQMSVDNGCEIRVSKDTLPSCALSQDRLCQITGEVDSVRKGLNAVAEVLFAHPPKESDAAAGAHLSGSSSHSLFNRSDGLPSGMQSNFHIPFQGPSQANRPFDIAHRRPNIVHFPTLPEAQVHGHAAVPVQPLTFRLLCSKDKVGSIIGKGGNIVNSIQKDTGCEIKVLETVLKTSSNYLHVFLAEIKYIRFS